MLSDFAAVEWAGHFGLKALRRASPPTVLAVVSTAPFWVTRWPYLIDYPSHVARFHVMLKSHPALAEHYDFNWRLVGNLGADLLMFPLAALFGIDRAAFLIAASIPPLTVLAIFAVSRAVGRPLGVGAFMALPLVFANPYLLGFLNYTLGVALALFAFAAWIKADLRHPLIFIAVAWAVWLCHMAAWAALAVMCGGYELSRTRNIKPLVFRLWPVALPGIMLLLSGGGSVADVVREPGDKVRLWIEVLGYRSFLFDVLTIALLITTLIMAARNRIKFDPRLGIPAILFAVLTIVIPPGLGGGDLADLRLAQIALIFAVLSLDWVSAWAWAFAILFLVKVAVIALNWNAQGAEYARSLRALQHIPEGAKVRAVVLETKGALLRSPFAHFPGYAVGSRGALVNSNFAIPGVHLLSVPSDPTFIDPTHDIQIPAGSSADLRKLEDQFIWLFPGDVRYFAPQGYNVIYADRNSLLFKRAPDR